MTTKIQLSTTYGMQQKWFQQGSLQKYKSSSGNKKNLKQPNFTTKATRERRKNKSQSQQKERNHKDQSRNKLNRNKKQQKVFINKSKSRSFYHDAVVKESDQEP